MKQLLITSMLIISSICTMFSQNHHQLKSFSFENNESALDLNDHQHLVSTENVLSVNSFDHPDQTNDFLFPHKQ